MKISILVNEYMYTFLAAPLLNIEINFIIYD